MKLAPIIALIEIILIVNPINGGSPAKDRKLINIINLRVSFKFKRFISLIWVKFRREIGVMIEIVIKAYLRK